MRQFAAWLASTRAVLLIVGITLAALAVTTVTNPRLDSLPWPTGLAAITGLGAGAGIVGGIFGPTRQARRVTGAALMAVAALRGWAFAAQIAGRTDGIVEWAQQSNPVLVWVLGWYLGFLVWARATSEAYRKAGG